MHPEFRHYTDEEIDAAVLAALREVDLSESHRVTVRALVRSRAVQWRSCCGGNCTPCIARIEEAVDRSRARLESGDSPTLEEERNWGLEYS